MADPIHGVRGSNGLLQRKPGHGTQTRAGRPFPSLGHLVTNADLSPDPSIIARFGVTKPEFLTE